jgi:hypothetical protein
MKRKRAQAAARKNGKSGRRGAASSMFGGKLTSNRKTMDASLSPLGSEEQKRGEDEER